MAPGRINDATQEVGDAQFKKDTEAFTSHLNGMYVDKWRKTKAEKELNARLGHSSIVLNKHMGGNRNFVYRINGEPVGLMSMSVPANGSGVKIHGLVTRPDTKGVGSKLIEQAVKLSMEQGRHGRVDLEFLEFSGSAQAYHAMGFMGNGDWNSNSMYLLPSAQQKHWMESNGEWKLRKLAARPPRVVPGGV